MTFKVFISSSMKNMRIVKELKGTLERYRILPILPSRLILPEAMGELMPMPIPSEILEHIAENIKRQMETSDCILVIIGRSGRHSEFVGLEIRMAIALDKLVVPIVEEGSEIPEILTSKDYILIDRNNPKLSYERAAQYLSTLGIEKERRNAVGGLLLLGLGFLLLSALSED